MKQTFYWLLLCPALLAGCSKDDTTSPPDKTPSSHKEITGYVQKGPFITGTSITVQELTNILVPTGKTFEAQIKEDNGNFKLNGALHISQGSFFKKTTGEGTHFTPDTLVGNQCTFYLYRGSIVNAFDLELVESERSFKNINFPSMEIEANMSYEFIIKVNRDDFVTIAYNRPEL